MGGWITHIWWGGDPDIADPVSGLSRRDIFAVRKSWAPVYANSVATGTEILKRLFKTFPETKDFFKILRKLPEDEYMDNAQFKAHVINLMSALNLAILNLHQPDVVAAMMNKIGESHKKRLIKEEHFLNLKQVLVDMFIEVLKLDDKTLGAWGRTVDFWFIHIFATLNNSDPR